MTKLAQTQFLANAQSTIVFGRPVTASEQLAISNFKKDVIAAGRQVGVDMFNEPTLTYVNRWSDINDATGYVALCNGFSPAPTAATAEAV